MSELLSGFGLTLPQAMFALPIVTALLVYAYMRRGRGARITVASVLLMRSLDRTIRARRRFVPPPRFFFELLCALLLLLAGAGLFRRSASDRQIMIIDNSLRTSVSGNTGTVLSDALSEAEHSLSASSSTAIISAAPGMVEITEGFAGRPEAIAALRKITPAFSSSPLASVVAKALTTYPGTSITIFTPRRIEIAGEQSRISVRRVGTVGALSENVALSAISLGRTDEGLDVKVQASAFTASPVQVFVSLTGYGPDGATVDLGRVSATIGPNETKQLSFGPLTSSPHALRARLSAPGAQNALIADDAAWVAVNSSSDKLALVAALSPAELRLDQIPGLQLSWVRPNDYNPARPPEGKAIIFHRFSPPALPPRPALLILPEESTGALSSHALQAGGALTQWTGDHPVTAYLRLSSLELPRFSPLELPVWGRELLRASAGTAAYAGETGGVRIVALGFEIFPWEGKQSRLLSILTLNALRWLSGAMLQDGFRSVYNALDRQEVAQLESIEIAGAVPQDEDIYRLARPGLYRTVKADGSRTLLAVNFFDPSESNLSLVAPVTLQVPAAASDDRTTTRPLVVPITWMALLLLLLDLALLTSRGFRAVR